jgi:excisionase family DNA binding protein
MEIQPRESDRQRRAGKSADRSHIIRLLEKGEIPISKVGAHRRIKVSDLVGLRKRNESHAKKAIEFLG